MPPDVGFHLKLYKLSKWSSADSQPGNYMSPSSLASILPLTSKTRVISLELLPGLITYFSGYDSSCLNLFFDMLEYLAKASFLACKNCSCSCAAFSNGFGILLGGKYLGFFGSSLTSSPSPLVSSSPFSPESSPSFSSSFLSLPSLSLPVLFFVESGAKLPFPAAPDFSFSSLNLFLF